MGWGNKVDWTIIDRGGGATKVSKIFTNRGDKGRQGGTKVNRAHWVRYWSNLTWHNLTLWALSTFIPPISKIFADLCHPCRRLSNICVDVCPINFIPLFDFYYIEYICLKIRIWKHVKILIVFHNIKVSSFWWICFATLITILKK